MVAREAHNLKVAGSSPAPVTKIKIMTELECIKRLSELECKSDEYNEIFNELIKHWPQANRESYLKAIKKLEHDKISQEKYLAENKGLDILEYDTETFMPIYKGKRKWVK